jgi:hypothetical protein
MDAFGLGAKKIWDSTFGQIGNKKTMDNANRIGVKLSHQATKTLGDVEKAAGGVSKAATAAGIVPLALFADAVASGAKTGKIGIEVGKDVGRGIQYNDASAFGAAKSKLPALAASAAKTSADMEGAAVTGELMFV